MTKASFFAAYLLFRVVHCLPLLSPTCTQTTTNTTTTTFSPLFTFLFHMGLDLLPRELVQHVISFADPAALGRLAQVSCYWKHVCEDVGLWRVVYENHFGGPLSAGGYVDSLKSCYVEMKEMKETNSKLLWAIIHGHHVPVRVLFPFAFKEYKNEELKSTYLCIACGDASAQVSVKVVKELLTTVDVNGRGNTMRETPLHIASKHGHVEIVRLLLANKANVNEIDKYGRTALHKAAYEGRTKVVEVLLNTPGVNVDVEELCYGQTALHSACSRNHVDIAVLLLRANSNINAVDWDGWTPLHIASFKNNTTVVNALLRHDADFRREHNAWNVLHNGDPGLRFHTDIERGRDNVVALFSNTVK